jgi:septum formation protein
MAMKAGLLLLASASPRRVELLRQLEIPFRVELPKVTEVMPEHLAPHEICLANAAAKARSVAARFPEHLVLGADTEVALGARVFGKPRHRREAADYLRALAGRTHQVITGVCLLCADQHFRVSFAETTHVTFRPLSEKMIGAYLRKVDPRDKAGGYAVQEGGEQIIEAIEGSLSNVVGLPLAAVCEALKDVPAGLRPNRRDGRR